METKQTSPTDGVRLKLPATSANLGPGFDALGLAMDFYLHVEGWRSDSASLHVTGRNAAQITDPDDNLVLRTCRDVLQQEGIPCPTLSVKIHNDIPLGMGCGSSAAALVAGVALACYFGELRWDRRTILAEAARREGHPDNVAACVLGGFVASAMRQETVHAIGFQPATSLQLLLALPAEGVPTKSARALLPDMYSRDDAVQNVQNVALLILALAQGDEALLREAMADRLHQPYRESICPLLSRLLPLAGRDGIVGAALSGAGPAVLLLVQSGADRKSVQRTVRAALGEQSASVEMLWTGIAGAADLGWLRAENP